MEQFTIQRECIGCGEILRGFRACTCGDMRVGHRPVRIEPAEKQTEKIKASDDRTS